MSMGIKSVECIRAPIQSVCVHHVDAKVFLSAGRNYNDISSNVQRTREPNIS